MRTSILIPYGIITVVSAFAWQFAFSLNNGFVNGWFHWLPWIGADYNWFGHHWPAMFAIMVSEIWKTTPFMSLLLLAGLSQVSEDMLEAAKVDGATWWQRLFKVILPNMRAAIMVAVLFRALDAFRIFDNIYVMTKGAQNTESVVVPHLPPGHRAVPARDGVGAVGAAVPLGAADRLPPREALPGRPGAGTRRRPDEAAGRVPASWVGFVLILVWCLLPVVWIIVAVVQAGRPRRRRGSPQFLPKDVDAATTTRTSLQNDDFLRRAAQLVRHLDHRDTCCR